MHLFKPIKCARAWVNPDMHHGLWMTMTCQCRFVCCYQMYRPGERCREWGRLCMSGHRGYGEISIWHSILLWTFKAAQKNKVCQNGGVVRKEKKEERNRNESGPPVPKFKTHHPKPGTQREKDDTFVCVEGKQFYLEKYCKNIQQQMTN